MARIVEVEKEAGNTAPDFPPNNAQGYEYYIGALLVKMDMSERDIEVFEDYVKMVYDISLGINQCQESVCSAGKVVCGL